MNKITNNLPASIDQFLMDMAQQTELFNYGDISTFAEKCTKKDIKNLNAFKEEVEELWSYGVEDDDEDLNALYQEIKNIVKKED